jgi:glycosyltransferase involved in cell wall biosynthesis
MVTAADPRPSQPVAPTPRASIIVPAYQEGSAILPTLAALADSVRIPHEVLVVVDFPEDSTLAALADVAEEYPAVRAVVQDYGRGPANAIRYGMAHAAAPCLVVTMADGSDDARLIDDMVRLVERGFVVAAASRYMPGGAQVGGPLVKGMLSEAAGRSLHLFARVGTHDATNSFKAYSAEFVRSVGVDSDAGFEIGLELVAKARRARLPVAEIPTIWLDRAEGESHFQLRRWLPKYLRWYGYAYGRRIDVAAGPDQNRSAI